MIKEKEGWDPVDPFDMQDKEFWVKIEHLARYLFAADYLKQFHINCVADIACGIGYGIAELCRVANTVIAIDNSPKILEIANSEYGDPKVKFVQFDLDKEILTSSIGMSSIDAIVSFETLEHLINPVDTIIQFSQLLTSNGLLICSVPNVIFESRDDAGLPSNKYHKQFFSYRSFVQLLRQSNFEVLYRVGQSWTNILFKRESQLLRKKAISFRLGERAEVNTREMIRTLSYILGYPTVEDVDGSYSIIVVAQKKY